MPSFVLNPAFDNLLSSATILDHKIIAVIFLISKKPFVMNFLN